ncbi:MAG: 23S rRNA (adenine(2503)-C(2))-methyltransferase RlmN [Alphaproteobacteria bacterium]|nr:23S rRNA (adenine(2503)-C(2))-methyltransferase RlmN [Alphaproteobacteria bacterium]
MPKQHIIGLSKEELSAVLASWGEKPFRTKQIWQWLYFRGVQSFDDMTNLSKDLRTRLADNFVLTRPKIITQQISQDKTRKWLLEFDDGERVEMVYIPELDRGAVCLSTQVGCAMGCKFCHTGSQKLKRNLTAGEIVSQFMVARDTYGEWPSPTDATRYLSNIVVMGMGEPLQNEDNVIKALNILSDGDGIAISRRRITMSTCGIAPKICDVLEKTGVRLAISLHAPNNEIRNALMPINKAYPIEQILAEAQKYQQKDGSRYVTFEYLMLQNINDSPQHAKELIALLKKHKIRATFNLIPFNPWPGCDFMPSTPERVKVFADLLNQAGFAAPVRVARGQDILAACGQLKSSTQKTPRT